MIQAFNHHAMATYFQVRIATDDAGYAAQAAHAAFDLTDHLETLLSRFQENSEISAIARLEPGETLRLSEPTFACLEIARQMEAITQHAFSATPAAKQQQPELPGWRLDAASLSLLCESGQVQLDLGAIGKGFALDRMAEVLLEWDCPAYLLVAGGSSILAGAAPPGTPGWSSGLGEDHAQYRYWLRQCSLSGSGIAVKGQHIVDPLTGQPAAQRARAWALTPTAAVSDALSTACMVLSEAEIAALMAQRPEAWLVLLHDAGNWRTYGPRELPPRAPAES